MVLQKMEVKFMALHVQNTIMEDLDIVSDEHGVVLTPNFASNAGVNGTGRRPTVTALSSLLRISGVNSMKGVKNVPVRIVFHNNILVAIGHYCEDKWCYLPNGGKLISMENMKVEAEDEFVEY